jgi:uncharacterized repeat protein (TIGR03803 family)
MRLSLISGLGFSVAISAVLAGCTGSPQGAQTIPNADLGGSLVTEHLLHSFGPGAGKGHFPPAGVLNVDGTLFGTAAGGASGNGLVFKLTPHGQYTVIYSFKGSPDGATPTASLINVNGVLYGTTAGGGANGDGAVFSITPSGGEKVIYSFKGGSDGFEPTGPLLNMNRVLYGNALGGTGDQGQAGIVFRVTTTGQYTVLHNFTGASNGDGYYPFGGLISIGGILYGTTFYGGSGSGYSCNSQRYGDIGCGTVYSITTRGMEKVLYSFNASPDGARPGTGLTKINSTMYGTTTLGGSACLSGGGLGCGTVFSIDTSGNETVLHSFTGPPDGAAPSAPLLALDGTLYGTTKYGGSPGCHNYSSCGTVFKITTSGNESIIHSFTGYQFASHADGELPDAGLISFRGDLIGTTQFGGIYSGRCGAKGLPKHGCGTVFSVVP